MLETEIRDLILKEQLIVPGDRILVAVSGGPDSICLLHLLYGLRKVLDFEIGIAHINHGLRGEESDGEEQFVKDLAKQLELPMFVHSEDVMATSQRLGLSFELTARKVRFDYFEKIMKQEKYNKTALGHHRNDQVETIIHRLMRGAGLNGLAGMRLIRDHKYIRPLLHTPRSSIINWLKEEKISYQLDSSNESPSYTRNSIRLHLIPQLERYNPDLIKTIGTMSQSLDWDRSYLEELATEIAKKEMQKEGDKVILSEAAFKQPRAISSRLIFIALEKLKGSRSDLTMGQVLDVLDLAEGQTGRRIDLKKVVAANHYGRVELSLKKNEGLIKEELTERTIDIAKLPLSVDFGRYQITFSNEPQESLGNRIDASRLGNKLILRRRRPQDRIQMIGMNGHKKVQRIFIDRKIHRELRDQLPIITDEKGDILYIHPGICAESFRITPKTDKILYITVMETDNYDK